MEICTYTENLSRTVINNIIVPSTMGRRRHGRESGFIAFINIAPHERNEYTFDARAAASFGPPAAPFPRSTNIILRVRQKCCNNNALRRAVFLTETHIIRHGCATCVRRVHTAEIWNTTFLSYSKRRFVITIALPLIVPRFYYFRTNTRVV